MGADLIVATLWSKGNVPSGGFDWEAGLRVARELSESSCQELQQQAWPEGDTDEDVRDLAVQYVRSMQQHFTGYSRVLVGFDTPDGSWTCWLTGGMSWGDSPSDLYDAVNDLWAVPEVLAALGFWTGEVT